MWNIFKLLLNKCTKEFISLKRIRNNKEVKPKWMNQKIKRIIRETKTARFKNKSIRDKGNYRLCRRFILDKEIRKVMEKRVV